MLLKADAVCPKPPPLWPKDLVHPRERVLPSNLHRLIHASECATVIRIVPGPMSWMWLRVVALVWSGSAWLAMALASRLMTALTCLSEKPKSPVQMLLHWGWVAYGWICFFRNTPTLWKAFNAAWAKVTEYFGQLAEDAGVEEEAQDSG